MYRINRFAVKELKSFLSFLHNSSVYRASSQNPLISDRRTNTNNQPSTLSLSNSNPLVVTMNMPLCCIEDVSIRGQIAGGLAGPPGVLDKGTPRLSCWLSPTPGRLGSGNRLLSPDLLPPDGSRVCFCDSHPWWTHSVLVLHSSLHLFTFSSLHNHIKRHPPFIPSPHRVQITILLFFNLDIQLFSSMRLFHLISLTGSSFLGENPLWVCMWVRAHMLRRRADARHSKTSLIRRSRDPQRGCTLIGASEPLI